MSDTTLYGYWRSSTSYRLRIALNLKGVAYDQSPVNIAPGADEQFSDAYRAKNPQMRVPTLETPEGAAGQSMALIEWLDETYPEPPFLPEDPWTRLQCRAFADVIACDIHPVNNLSILQRLQNRFGADQTAVRDWYVHWVETGFKALEAQAAALPQHRFLFGDAPGLAEICLVPQMWNARRFKTPLEAFPRLVEIDAACCELDAFAKAAPEAQPDAT